jgi:diacylglycerol kinase (ATP)
MSIGRKDMQLVAGSALGVEVLYQWWSLVFRLFVQPLLQYCSLAGMRVLRADQKRIARATRKVEPMRTVLIVNPTAGISTITEHRRSPEETEHALLEGLRASGIEPDLLHTTLEESGSCLAARAAQEGADLVIAAGGDGTVHAVATGLVGTACVLGIIPTGTLNNLARSLQIPASIPAACRAIATGQTRAIDVGMINEQVFLEVAGVGLEASLAPAGEEIKHPGIPSIIHGILSALKTFFGFKAVRMQIAVDGGIPRSYRTFQVTICNAPSYALHLQLASHILMDDGLLDVVVYQNLSKFAYLRHVLAMRWRRPPRPSIKHLRVRSLRVIPAVPMEIHADGEPGGFTPAEIAALPATLRIRGVGKDAPGLQRDVSER